MTGLVFSDASVCEVSGVIVRITADAVLLDVAGLGEAWIPKRVISDWAFLPVGTKRGLRLVDWEEGDMITVEVKKWFARKEGLVS